MCILAMDTTTAQLRVIELRLAPKQADEFFNMHSIFAYSSPRRSAANEQVSTTRQRERGQRCAVCDACLGGAAWANLGTRYCIPCTPRPHAVYMHFQHFGNWRVTFSLLPDQRPLARRLQFTSLEKIVELARRTQATEETLRGLQHSIGTWGRGTVTLQLTEEQLDALCPISRVESQK